MESSPKIERQMERLRPAQMRQLREEAPIAYLPLGILEWHGPHNPLGLDGVKAHALCCRVADQVGGVVFPTLYYSTPPAAHYLDVDHYDPAFSEAYGTPQENHATDKYAFGNRLEQWELFGRVLNQSLRQIARYGFGSVLILCGHYPLSRSGMAAETFSREYKIPIWMGHEGMACDPGQGDHAGQWETSLTYALEPETVAPNQFPAQGEPNGPGIFGDPIADVTPELAQRNLELCLQGLEKKAKELLARAAG